MSSGDIDDRLAPEGELQELYANNNNLAEYLWKAYLFKPILTFFIPFGAGISEDGSRVYISHDIQTDIDGVKCENALVRHETTEWGVREFCDIGVDYASDPRGHRLGNRAEHDRVVQLLDRPNSWELYGEVIDPQVVIDERQNLDGKPIPRDLALYPYDEEFIEKIKEAMWNDRSIEEWEKLK